MTLRWHAVEEVYELLDAIESRDDQEMIEELGDVLLQVVFHCQLAQERGSFNLDAVARHITTKLIRRHPHVFGNTKVTDVAEVWKNWEAIKRAEKHGTRHARASVLDGIPRHLPALLRAEKLVKKAKRGKLLDAQKLKRKTTKTNLARELFQLATYAQGKGWSAEELLRNEIGKQERLLRQAERRTTGKRAC
jgi:nucleoside triphosphate diphosphatase